MYRQRIVLALAGVLVALVLGTIILLPLSDRGALVVSAEPVGPRSSGSTELPAAESYAVARSQAQNVPRPEESPVGTNFEPEQVGTDGTERATRGLWPHLEHLAVSLANGTVTADGALQIAEGLIASLEGQPGELQPDGSIAYRVDPDSTGGQITLLRKPAREGQFGEFCLSIEMNTTPGYSGHADETTGKSRITILSGFQEDAESKILFSYTTDMLLPSQALWRSAVGGSAIATGGTLVIIPEKPVRWQATGMRAVEVNGVPSWQFGELEGAEDPFPRRQMPEVSLQRLEALKGTLVGLRDR